MNNFTTVTNNSDNNFRFPWEVSNVESLFPNLESILEQGLQNTSEYLSRFRFDAGYNQKLEEAFGNNFNLSAANQIFDKLAQGDFSDAPNIEIVSSNNINGANGAFAKATGKIYLAAEFISQNAQNIDAIVAVLLEEYGHYVDSRINTKDAAGDEGDIFSRLVQGKDISQQELAILQAEDDSATVTLDGQVVEIEQNQDLIGANGDWSGDWSSANRSGSGTDRDDNFNRGAGDGMLNGRGGWDKVSYAGLTQPISTTNASFWDQRSYVYVSKNGTTDRLEDIEEIIGTNYDDVIYAFKDTQLDTGLKKLCGEGGNDKLYAVAEYIKGQSNWLFGGDGNDVLSADIGKDGASQTLTGGSGVDSFQLVGNLQNAEKTSSAILNALRDIGINAVSLIPGVGGLLSLIGSTVTTLYSSLSEAGSLSGSGDDLVYIKDFTFGEDVIVLPNLSGEESYTFEIVYTKGDEVSFLIQVQNNITQNIAQVTIANPMEVYDIDFIKFLGSSINTRQGDYTFGESFKFDSSNARSFVSISSLNSNDSITGGKYNDTIDGKGGNDTLNGNDGNDTLIGDGGYDTLYGGAGSDSLYGGDGDDFLDGDLGTAVSGSAQDTIYGGTGNDILWGGEENDYLYGEHGNDTLYGEDGNDILNPGYNQWAVDTVDGGAGDDLLQVDYSSKNNGAGIHLGWNNTNFIYHRNNSNDDNWKLVEFSNIERFDITGTQYNDVFEGLSGNDIFNGGGNHDILIGNAGNDTLIGGAGTDTLNGGAGSDILNPGYSQWDTDTVDGGAGDDLLQVDYSNKNNGFGIHLGWQGANVIYHRGGENNGDRSELVKFSFIERFGIIGTQYNDVFEGGSGNDIFNGGSGHDILIGAAGKDTLIGGDGKDTLTGGTGADYFDYNNLKDSLLENFDVITDFNFSDRFLVTTARSAFYNVEFVTSLDKETILALLTGENFDSNVAAQFTFGSRSFVAINDATAGFDATTDTIIEVTGLTGALTLNNFTTTLV